MGIRPPARRTSGGGPIGTRHRHRRGAAASGILYYGLAFWLYLTGLQHVTASYAGAFLPLIPVFGVTAGYLAGERPATSAAGDKRGDLVAATAAIAVQQPATNAGSAPR